LIFGAIPAEKGGSGFPQCTALSFNPYRGSRRERN